MKQSSKQNNKTTKSTCKDNACNNDHANTATKQQADDLQGRNEKTECQENNACNNDHANTATKQQADDLQGCNEKTECQENNACNNDQVNATNKQTIDNLQSTIQDQKKQLEIMQQKFNRTLIQYAEMQTLYQQLIKSQDQNIMSSKNKIIMQMGLTIANEIFAIKRNASLSKDTQLICNKLYDKIENLLQKHKYELINPSTGDISNPKYHNIIQVIPRQGEQQGIAAVVKVGLLSKNQEQEMVIDPAEVITYQEPSENNDSINK